ncbi:hypothetical protein GCM10011515_08610 [Tsuneonella deserti]|uniref:Uncharacterized protein n=1 Tax=Tsuneonella deserti TaxID=2035528 RepID=A0ABQ1S377_9SPHN|nr:hypothetical protein [Tsuneonella deserti]GGD91234.1 hypothetical protein GCM10011515_08610 [Tsuneonella deserti]
MPDIRRIILDALPKDLLLDLEDRLRAEALRAYEVVKRELPVNAKRAREAEGQIRFRLQEQGYEEVVTLHGGQLIVDGVMIGTDLKIFQPFARFPGRGTGVVLGFAAMPEPRKVPVKNQSRAAGVSLNLALQPTMFDDPNSVQPTDIFALFLTARDRQRAGRIEEIAIGVIGAEYRDFIFYESLEVFLSGYASDEGADEVSREPLEQVATVRLKASRQMFVPPEITPEKKPGEGASE